VCVWVCVFLLVFLLGGGVSVFVGLLV